MTAERITVELTDGVATITLAGPGRVATLDGDLVARARDAVAAVLETGEARCIVLRGTEHGFCLGADLRTLLTVEPQDIALGPPGRDAGELVRLLREAPIPSVAAVDGLVIGGGLALALACDVIVAGDGARFGVGYGDIATTPDMGASLHLVRDVGFRRALWLYVSGEMLDAEEARRLGLVSTVVPAAELRTRAAAIAGRLAGPAAETLAAGRDLLRTAADASLAEQIDRELPELAAALARPSFRAAAEALIARIQGADRR